jgi:hypothetical protein
MKDQQTGSARPPRSGCHRGPLGWPEYALYRVALTGPRFEVGQFAAIWAAVLLVVALPGVIGTVLGGLYATRNSPRGLGCDSQPAQL